MSEEKKYYYARRDMQHGPFTLEEMKRKGLMTHSKVWHAGLSEWMRADQIPELANALGFPPYIGKIRKERKKVKPATTMLYAGITLATMFFMTVLYFLLFDEFSESELVMMSFFWVGPLCFGIAGWISCGARNPRPYIPALISMGAGLLTLASFFELFWAML